MANISAGKTKAQVDSRREKMYRGEQGKLRKLTLNIYFSYHEYWHYTPYKVIFNVNCVQSARVVRDTIL